MRQYALYDWKRKAYHAPAGIYNNSIDAQLTTDALNIAFPTGNAQPRFSVVLLEADKPLR